MLDNYGEQMPVEVSKRCFDKDALSKKNIKIDRHDLIWVVIVDGNLYGTYTSYDFAKWEAHKAHKYDGRTYYIFESVTDKSAFC